MAWPLAEKLFFFAASLTSLLYRIIELLSVADSNPLSYNCQGIENRRSVHFILYFIFISILNMVKLTIEAMQMTEKKADKQDI